MGTKGKYQSLSWTLKIQRRVSGPSINTRTGHISPKYHVVVVDTLSTVKHMRNVTIPRNWKKLVKEHSYFSTQGEFTLAKEWHLK